jgi:hypothetical protein
MKLKSLLDGKDYFYVMHLSYGYNNRREPLWDYAKREEVIGLNHYTVSDNWNKDKVKERARSKGISAIWEKQFELFYNDMGKDDIVVILAGWNYVLGVAKSKKDKPRPYNPKLEDIFFPHTREVSWLKEYDFDKPLMLQEEITFYNTLKKVNQDTVWGIETWKKLVNIELPD